MFNKTGNNDEQDVFLGCMGILAASAMFSSCSSDNDDPTPSPNPGPEVVYKWTTNGGLKACDHILFGTDDKENANGTQIGNGDQEFVSQASRL